MAKQSATITSNAITVTGSYCEIAGSDNLETINGGVEGQVLVLCAASGESCAVVNGGNIRLNTTRYIGSSSKEQLTLIYDGSNWRELAYSITESI